MPWQKKLTQSPPTLFLRLSFPLRHRSRRTIRRVNSHDRYARRIHYNNMVQQYSITCTRVQTYEPWEHIPRQRMKIFPLNLTFSYVLLCTNRTRYRIIIIITVRVPATGVRARNGQCWYWCGFDARCIGRYHFMGDDKRGGGGGVINFFISHYHGAYDIWFHSTGQENNARPPLLRVDEWGPAAAAAAPEECRWIKRPSSPRQWRRRRGHNELSYSWKPIPRETLNTVLYYLVTLKILSVLPHSRARHRSYILIYIIIYVHLWKFRTLCVCVCVCA